MNEQEEVRPHHIRPQSIGSGFGHLQISKAKTRHHAQVKPNLTTSRNPRSTIHRSQSRRNLPKHQQRHSLLEDADISTTNRYGLADSWHRNLPTTRGPLVSASTRTRRNLSHYKWPWNFAHRWQRARSGCWQRCVHSRRCAPWDQKRASSRRLEVAVCLWRRQL